MIYADDNREEAIEILKENISYHPHVINDINYDLYVNYIFDVGNVFLVKSPQFVVLADIVLDAYTGNHIIQNETHICDTIQGDFPHLLSLLKQHHKDGKCIFLYQIISDPMHSHIDPYSMNTQLINPTRRYSLRYKAVTKNNQIKKFLQEKAVDRRRKLISEIVDEGFTYLKVPDENVMTIEEYEMWSIYK
jgi:hypothetical protein